MALQYQRAAPAATVVDSHAPLLSKTKAAKPSKPAVNRQVVPSSKSAPESGSVGRWVTIGVIVLLGVLVVMFGIFLYQTHNQVKRLETAQRAALNTDEVQTILQEQIAPVVQQFAQQQTAVQETQRQFMSIQQGLNALAKESEVLKLDVENLQQARKRSWVPSNPLVAVANKPAAPPARQSSPSSATSGDAQAALLSSLIHQTDAPSSPDPPSSHTAPPKPSPIPTASANPFMPPPPPPPPAPTASLAPSVPPVSSSSGLTPVAFPNLSEIPAPSVTVEM